MIDNSNLWVMSGQALMLQIGGMPLSVHATCEVRDDCKLSTQVESLYSLDDDELATATDKLDRAIATISALSEALRIIAI